MYMNDIWFLWKNQPVAPYESFYSSYSERFFKGSYGDGISRTVPAQNPDLAIIEIVYE